MRRTSRAAQKGLNLRLDPRCSVAVLADDMHIVIEGTASPVDNGATLDKVAEAYRPKYNWRATVVEGGFEAPTQPRLPGRPLRPLPGDPERRLRLGYRRLVPRQRTFAL